MVNLSHIFTDMPVSLKLAAVLIITIVNNSLLYLTVSCILRFSKNIHAHFKHYTWFFIICFFLFIPLLSMLIPSPDILPLNNSFKGAFTYDILETKSEQQAIAAQSSEGSQATEENSYDPSHMSMSASDVNRPKAHIQWQTAVVLIWFVGVMLSLIHILVGRIGLHCMIKGATPVNNNSYASLLQHLCNRLAIRQKVQVWKSSQCITPFTCYLFKPVILLPVNTRKWFEDRLRVVLLHELAHIKRRDHITRFIARFACALLWFVPPVWIAYNRMQIEEEKACDASVIGTGVRTSDYAGHIIDIARSTRGRVLSLMFQHSFSRKSILEPRIRNILRLRRTGEPVRRGVLIRILVICFACLLALHVVNPVSARDNGGLFKKEAPIDLLYGRWFNEQDYNPWKASFTTHYLGKLIVDQDGSIHLYQTPTCPELSHVGGNGYYTVTDSYIDHKGNYLYKLAMGYPTNKTFIIYELWRIDPSGTTMEITWDYTDYPSKIDASRYEYYTFYRK